jgi:ribonuclease BN (tRNA processing enzyme)
MDGMETTNRQDVARLRVLASGSAGNCSVLQYGPLTRRRACLIDAGLSPRRTFDLLDKSGIDRDSVDMVLLTHLDHDHWSAGWRGHWPRRWQLLLSRNHIAFGRRQRMLPQDQLLALEEAPAEVLPGVRLTTIDAAHDEQGVSSFRFDITLNDSTGSLGFATDLGRVPAHLVECFQAVHVLAIESNYCPDLQMASNRPDFLKRRIMGGSGHLSNQQASEAIAAISPRDHVVLLHLSRDCNDPGLVASLHAGADYALTITGQDAPSRWVGIPGNAGVPTPRDGEQLMIFSANAAPRPCDQNQ